MASIHPIHHPDPAYGSPEVHIPYPAEPVHYPPYLNDADEDADHESLTGETKGDETTAEELAQPEAVFSNMVLEKIGIGPSLKWAQYETSQEKERTSVLLPIPRSATEEKELHEKVMASLRDRVAALEEEELFESSMKHFTQRSSVATEANGGMITAAGNPAGVVGESNAAGLGEQPRMSDVRELLRADTRQIWSRERERRARQP